jgi:cytochrome P450
VRDEITAEAEHVVERLVAQGSFDAATEFANHLPVSVVSNLIGLPEKGRERMLMWAEELFNCFEPISDRTVASFPVLEEMMHYATKEAVPGKLKPGSWAAGIHDAVAAGEVPAQACPAMMVDYLGPSLDTTIFAISNAVWLFANNPDQWDLVRSDPKLMPSAVNEVLRYDAPIQDFSRYVARDVNMDGVVLPAGSRAIVFYGAANRDERKYPDPDRFDVRRRPGDHLGFGAGPHDVHRHEPRPHRDAGPVHRAGQTRSALHDPGAGAGPEQRAARLQDVAGRRQLTRSTRGRTTYPQAERSTEH